MDKTAAWGGGCSRLYSSRAWLWARMLNLRHRVLEVPLETLATATIQILPAPAGGHDSAAGDH